MSLLVKSKTVLIIAHRLRTVSGADQIIVLNQGYVEEIGTHKDLYKKDGMYRTMIDIQQDSYSWKLKNH